MIAALFFDGDQTLWDFDKVMRRALDATLVELRNRRPGPAAEQLTVESMVADRQAVAREAANGGTNLEQLRLAGFRRTLARLRLRDGGLTEHLTSFYLRRRFSDAELYADTLPSLAALRRSYALGLLSNGNSHPDRCGLAGVFSTVVFAQDHGVAKPDRRLFDIAAAEIGIEPSGIAMVGDSLTNDVTAAQTAGWRGIWLNRDAGTCPDQHTPDAQITSLAQLASVLADLS